MLGEAGYPPDARVAAPHAVARRSSISAIPFSTPRFAAIWLKDLVALVTHLSSASRSVPQRRSSLALGMGRSDHSSALALGNHSSMLAFNGSTEDQEPTRVEQLEKRLSEVLQREASLNV
jgi:hypothetical protein